LQPPAQQDSGIEVIQLYDRPAALSDHGDVMIMSTTPGGSRGSHLELELQRSSMRTLALQTLLDAAREPEAHLANIKALLGAVAGKAIADPARAFAP